MEFIDRIPTLLELLDVVVVICVAFGVALGIAAQLPVKRKRSRR